MTYAKVINGEIVEYNRTLPFSTENTSFGVGTDSETLKSYGYLPIIGSEPEYDRLTHRIGNVSYVVGADVVIKAYDVVALTVAEIRERDVPKMITPRQLRLQLLSATLLDEVETMCGADRAMSIWFEYSLDFQRSHDMVKAMGTQLGMSESDMDNFFIEASKL